MTEAFETLWLNGDLATLAPHADDPIGLRPGWALASRNGAIAWIGPQEQLPPDSVSRAETVVDAGGRWITPGLVDCHTHLVFAGDRSREFEARVKGAGYEEIARAGGGIRSTVSATRRASREQLFVAARERVGHLLSRGVTTVEIKSGYGLDLETELKQLRVIRRLGRETPLTVRSTFLAAHALPPEFEGRRAEYLRLVLQEILPAAEEEGLVDAVDAFCEDIAFTAEECETVLAAGRRMGLDLRLHADQLSNSGGAALAARVGARSADHLEYVSEAGVDALARSGTVAVLLPGAYYFLGEERRPPVERFRRKGVPFAVATDLNPGSSPVASLPLALNLACVLFGVTPGEALAGGTRIAARVLGLESEIGSLEVGKRADLALWDVDHPRELSYWMGGDRCRAVFVGGHQVRPGSPPS